MSGIVKRKREGEQQQQLMHEEDGRKLRRDSLPPFIHLYSRRVDEICYLPLCVAGNSVLFVKMSAFTLLLLLVFVNR